MIKIRVIVAGGRDFSDYKFMKKKLLYYFGNYNMEDIEIISGTANGADKLGERFATEMGCKLTRMPAEWEKFGRKAGYIRNDDMAKYAKSDPEIKSACVCFWNGLSKGTKHMIDLAKKRKVNLKVVGY